MHAVPHAETDSELISGVSVFFRIVFAETHAQTNSYSKKKKKKKKRHKPVPSNSLSGPY